MSDEEFCSHCNGSGEGMTDGSRCGYCQGSGVECDHDAAYDAACERADYLNDLAKEEGR